MPTVRALLAEARARLANTETPSLDARLLLQHATGLEHAALVADPDLDIDKETTVTFAALVARRAAFEPVSRILGVREFYGRLFRVTPAVLDPRADTETIVEVCLQHLPEGQTLRLLDLGTGSGILAITLLAERPLLAGVAVDLSEAALDVAKHNAVVNGVSSRLGFLQSHWFQAVEGQFDLIVSNPPYIPSGGVAGLDVEVRDHDPHLALAGGDDGLACYRAIAAGASDHLVKFGTVVVEIGAGQEADIVTIFSDEGFQLVAQKSDLGGHMRALAFQNKP
jgi:release factor glutamine methyltransferase